jgi:hypothetical protein
MNQLNPRRKLKRTEAPSKPVRVYLKDKDRELIQAVARYRFVQTSTLRQFFFKGTPRSTALGRLTRLFHGHYLDRLEIPRTTAEPARDFVYCLGPKGAELLGLKETDDWKPKHNRVQLLFLQHRLDLTQFRVSLEAACGERWEEVKLTQWVDEKDKHQGEIILKFKVPDPKARTPGKKLIVKPDSAFILTHFGAQDKARDQSLWFLEIDRGTESSRVFEDKVRGYITYDLRVRQRLERLPFKIRGGGFRVATVTTSKTRRDNLIKLTHQYGDRLKGGRKQFWFATLEDITPERILDKIWRRVDQKLTDEKLTILDLTCVDGSARE